METTVTVHSIAVVSLSTQRGPPLGPSYRLTTAGIQFEARRNSRAVVLSPSYCDTVGTEVKAVRSFKQFTFTTARVPASVSQTAAM
jgi:hypothetical protein